MPEWVENLALLVAGGFLGELGRRFASWLSGLLERNRTLRRVARRESDADSDLRTTRLEAFQAMNRLRRQRVNSRFVYRPSPTDVGMIGTVVALDSRHPKHYVSVAWVSPPERNPTSDDHPPQVTMRWKELDEDPSAQKHLTAKMIGSDDDEDGWIRYVRLVRTHERRGR